uniref:Uncharacterized protein n=1 Tax=Arundo donax TaxID=35708 RepID=A0A0A9CT62_ARUDO
MSCQRVRGRWIISPFRPHWQNPWFPDVMKHDCEYLISV